MHIRTRNKRSVLAGGIGSAVLALGVLLWQSAGGFGQRSEAAT